MKVIKDIKNIDIFINIKYTEEDEYLLQHFQFNVSNKKHLDYIFDNRYLFKSKLDKLITSSLLKGFIKRVDSKEEVIMYYSKQDIPKNCIRKISSVVSPDTGCRWCEKAQEKGIFYYCPEKNKTYSQPISRCPVFKIKDVILT